MLSRYLEAEVLLVSASRVALTLGRLAVGSVRICADLLCGAMFKLEAAGLVTVWCLCG